jgi:hypothetical protein
MGLFDALTGKKSTTIAASGFNAMPKNYQQYYKMLLEGARDTLIPKGKVNSEMFTPLPQTEDETRSINMIREGLTPDQDKLNADIAMTMNPYDEYVINELNRQAQGENSLVNQYATRSGQQGSNRSFLGTSDVEQNRLNNIGMFKQSQYNTALNHALSTLPGLRQQDISNLSGVGAFQRDLNMQTKQAPFSALTAGFGLLGQTPTSFGGGQPQQTVKSGGGLGGFISNTVVPLASNYATGGAFGLSTGGQSFFNGGINNAINAARGAYGPGF